MRFIKVFVFILACIATSIASSIEVEPDAVMSDFILEFRDTQGLLEELANKIRNQGWRCDSISAASEMFWSTGFVIICNNFRYTYEIRDRGGRWVVTLD